MPASSERFSGSFYCRTHSLRADGAHEAVRAIGLAPATVKIGMVNIAYNLKRLVWLERPVVI